MAAVLFVVTIPTGQEEQRLIDEIISRQSDFHSAHHRGEQQFIVQTPLSNASTAKLSNQILTTQPTPSTIKPNANNNAITNFMSNQVPTTITTTTPSTPLNANFQYNVFAEGKANVDGRVTKIAMRAQEIGQPNVKCSALIDERDCENSAATPINEDSARNVRKSLESFRDVMNTVVSSKQHKKKHNEDSLDINIPNEMKSLEILLREILKEFQISNAIWTKDSEGLKYQVIFTIEYDAVYEKVLQRFHDWGIGDRCGSMVSVMNCIISKSHTTEEDTEEADEFKSTYAQKQGAWERFMNSVRSRLNVTQVVRDVRQDAAITLDFVILLISAAILASFGLVEDSVVFLASSMLISPLMGPIIAAVFGTAIKDRSLCCLGLRNELFGIILATLVGFIFGIVVGCTDERYGTGEGLTEEMLSRCEVHSVIVGIFTAIPSGAAGAIGILGGNVGSLVGVAISASILPPAVNSGLLWALACIYKFFETDSSRYTSVVKSHIYSYDQGTELAVLGAMSMCVTITNVLCVYLMGIIVLKLKEIAPAISRTSHDFWKHDIKIARDLKNNNFNTNTNAAIFNEFANLPKEDRRAMGIECNDLLKNLHLNETNQNTWSPFNNCDVKYERNYLTVHNLERLYATISKQQDVKRRRCSMLQRRGLLKTSDINSTHGLFVEKIPRSFTMPSHNRTDLLPSVTVTTYSGLTTENSTPTSSLNEKGRHKFLVTPAQDPLHKKKRDDSINI